MKYILFILFSFFLLQLTAVAREIKSYNRLQTINRDNDSCKLSLNPDIKRYSFWLQIFKSDTLLNFIIEHNFDFVDSANIIDILGADVPLEYNLKIRFILNSKANPIDVAASKKHFVYLKIRLKIIAQNNYIIESVEGGRGPIEM